MNKQYIKQCVDWAIKHALIRLSLLLSLPLRGIPVEYRDLVSKAMAGAPHLATMKSKCIVKYIEFHKSFVKKVYPIIYRRTTSCAIRKLSVESVPWWHLRPL